MGRFELRFDTIESPREILQLQHFLLQHPGGYDPLTYKQWVFETCIPDIKSGKRVPFGWWQRGALIADVILKVAEDDPDTAWLRHFRVESPDLIHRGLGEFAIRQIPFVAAELLADQDALSDHASHITVRLDTKADNPAMHFFERYGFVPIGQADLYGSGMDVIMEQTYALAS